MASKSQTGYMTAIALIIAASEIMEKNYRDKPGRVWIKQKNADLHGMAQKALLLAHGEITQDDIKVIWTKLAKMESVGLDTAVSHRSYLAMLIGITGDLLVEIPKTSVKWATVNEINALIVEMWEYFSIRNRREDLDTDGWKLNEVFNQEFKEAR